MPDQPAQTISALTDIDHQRLRDQRAVIEQYLGDEDSRRKYQVAAGKLGTIRAVLAAELFEPSQTYELQCLGVVFGDAFVLEMEMEWVMVEDEYGRNPAVRMPRTSIILYPITMISKRVERGEHVDVFEMFNRTAEQIEELQRRGH